MSEEPAGGGSWAAIAWAAPIDSAAASRAGAGSHGERRAQVVAVERVHQRSDDGDAERAGHHRATVFIADATPDRAAGTAPTTASVAGAITQPIDQREGEEPDEQHAGSGVGLPQQRGREHERQAGQPDGDRPAPCPIRPTARLDEPAPDDDAAPAAIGLMTAPASIAE